MAVNPKLFEFEDFYRTLVKSCERPERYAKLTALLNQQNWTVRVDAHGAPAIKIENQSRHVEDAYREFSLNHLFFEKFYDEAMAAW